MRLSWLAGAGLAVMAAAAGCDMILGIDDGIPREGGASVDATTDASDAGAKSDAADADASVPMCDPDAAFSPPTPFSTLNTAAQEARLRLVPPSELTGYFQAVRDGGFGGTDLYTASRASIGDTWKNQASVVGVNSSVSDSDPTISADQLTLYFSRSSELYRATRTTPTAGFGTPVALGAINSTLADFGPYLVADGTALYFSSTRDSDAGVAKIFVTQPLADGGFTAPAALAGTGLDVGDNRFSAVTADQLVLYFGSNRTATGTQGGYDIWIATRATTSLPFGTPRVAAEVSSSANEWPDWISADRCRLYFTSTRTGSAGGDDLWVATKTPP